MAKNNPADKAAAQAKRAARQARNERAKAAAEQRRREQQRKERLTLAAVVVGVVLAIGIGYGVVQLLNPDKPDTPPAAATDTYGLLVGEEDAPKSIVIYEDFLCPFCGQLEQTVGEQLDAAVEAGETSVEYRPVAFLERFGDYSVDSANAFAVVLEESGPEVAKEFHDLLFADQPSEDGPFPDTDELVDLAVEAGAEEADVRPGIEDGTFEGWIEAASEEASRNDVKGTPTVFIDGELAGENPGEMVQAVLEAAQ